MDKFKKIIVLIIALAMMLSVVACDKQEPTNENETKTEETQTEEVQTEEVAEPIELVYVGYGDEITYQITQDVTEKFEEEHEGVTVKVEFAPVGTWGEFSNKLTTRIAGGESIDLIGVAIEGTRLLVDKGLLAPLDDYIANDPNSQELLDDVAPALLEAFTVDDKLYEIPREWNSMVVVYNTKIFDEAGLEYPSADWTWDEFVEIAQKLTTGEGEDKVWGFANYYGPIQTMPWFISNGTSILDENMENSLLGSPEAAESMQFVNDLIYKYKCTPALESGTNIIQLFSAGRFAMIGGWQGLFPSFQSSDFTDFDIQVWPVNKTGASRTIIGVGGIGISESSQNKELAYEYLRALTAKEAIQEAADSGSAIPGRESAGTSDTFLSYAENSTIMYEGAYTGVPMPSPKNFPEMEQIFMRYFDIMVNSEMDVTEVMADLHQELQDAMNAQK